MKKAIIAIGIIGLLVYGGVVIHRKSLFHVFPGLSGPDDVSIVRPEPPTPVDRYGTGRPSRLAILIADPESPWLGLAHGLKTIGVPFLMTTDYQTAFQHKVVLVYPVLSGKTLSSGALRALAAHVQNGGTLIAVNVLGGRLEKVFGFEEALPGRSRFTLRFAAPAPESGNPAEDREQTLSLGNPEKAAEALGTYGYSNPVEAPVAAYEDGTAAITRRSTGKGKAYAVGLDLGDYLLKGYHQRAETLFRSYVNEFDPASDLLLRWLRRVYREGETDAVTLGTVPDQRAFSLIVTHDVDAGPSLKNSIEYARYEQSQGVRATYFIQTKYLKDWNDAVLLDDAGARDLAELDALGMELASHSVSHTEAFAALPAGSGEERYPSYRPFVKDRTTVLGGSILGELRVSKFLIERLGNQRVVSFRPGHLSNPRSLPQSLFATGYRYSSAVTANESLTHLPFQLNFDRDFRAELPVFEFPITVEDEFPPAMEERLAQAIELAGRIARSGGLYVLLIHPNETGAKLAFEKNLVEAVKDNAWSGSIRDFGEWWEARNAVSVDVVAARGGKTMELDAPLEIEGLVLQVPSNWKYADCGPAGCATPISPGIIRLKKIKGTVNLFFNLP